jgi:hypothetical protein
MRTAYINVRYGSLADILTSPRHVRFTPNNGHWSAHPSQHLAVGLRVHALAPDNDGDGVLLECLPHAGLPQAQGKTGSMNQAGRRFPPPWTVETIPGGLVVRDANGHSLANENST